VALGLGLGLGVALGEASFFSPGVDVGLGVELALGVELGLRAALGLGVELGFGVDVELKVAEGSGLAVAPDARRLDTPDPATNRAVSSAIEENWRVSAVRMG
jgi:hypothetical protein